MLARDSVGLVLSGMDLLKALQKGSRTGFMGEMRAGVEGAALKAPGAVLAPSCGQGWAGEQKEQCCLSPVISPRSTAGSVTSAHSCGTGCFRAVGQG